MSVKKYGFHWLENFGKEAKALKEHYPKLSHTQRLNLAAQRAGFRHYHEAQTLHKNHIKSMQEDRGGWGS